MNILNYIIWTVDPAIFTIPFTDYAPRWYGVLFALGFLLSQQVFFKIFKTEGRPEKDVERITGYMVIATIVGARLGHCLFYNPDYYLSNPIKILMIWEGGLASHGGALGIIVAIWLFCRKYNYRFLWVIDRMVIVAALTGAMIRTGNLFNSEMEGTLTNSNTGVVYARATHDVLNYSEDVDDVRFIKGGEMQSEKAGFVPITAIIEYRRGYQFELNDKMFVENQLKNALSRYTEVKEHVDFGEGPLAYKNYEKDGKEIVEIYALGKVRHAAQLYEALYCVILMIVLYWLWSKKRDVLPQGFNFALFMIVLWSLRFVDEFFKMNQEAFEDNLTLNMGQILSIPLTVAGIIMMVWVYRQDRKMSDFK
ncbi:prolipoprotein diacylglyceryl transferase [Ekhidna sp.]|uniref:prolipoprotein diacylglyceryl transferase n=1 Tax=Ekhidna sp. TaxID=2608089 RepID=UPI003CCB9183